MEETVTKLSLENRESIKSVLFKYPELMADNAANEIVKEYYSLLSLKDQLYEAREKVRELETKLKNAEIKWNNKSSLFDLTFNTYTKDVIHYKVGGLLKNLGNDILGTHNIT